jgi:hypothetical protein
MSGELKPHTALACSLTAPQVVEHMHLLPFMCPSQSMRLDRPCVNSVHSGVWESNFHMWRNYQYVETRPVRYEVRLLAQQTTELPHFIFTSETQPLDTRPAER